MSWISSQLMLSPYAKISLLSANGKAKISHMVNGKTFEVGQAVVEILQTLQVPHSYEQLEAAFTAYKSDLKNILSFLLVRDIISEKENQQEQVIGITPVQERLFNLENFNPADPAFKVPFVGVPFGRGNPKSVNTAKFPFHIRRITHQLALNFTNAKNKPFNFDCLDSNLDFTNLRSLLNRDALRDYGNVFIDVNESSQFIYDKLHTLAATLFKANRTPFFIGGDHSISYPLIKAAAEKYDNLHVIHFDAHTDTYTSPYTYIEHPGKVHHHGNFVSKCLENTSVTRFYQFGIRGVCNLLQQAVPAQTIYWASQLKKLLAEDGTIDLPDNVPYYITFDIDVLDPAIAPGTATPVPGGLSMEEIKKLFQLLLPNKKIVGFDIVEASPEYDKANMTAELAVEVILCLLNYLPIEDSPGH